MQCRQLAALGDAAKAILIGDHMSGGGFDSESVQGLPHPLTRRPQHLRLPLTSAPSQTLQTLAVPKLAVRSGERRSALECVDDALRLS